MLQLAPLAERSRADRDDGSGTTTLPGPETSATSSKASESHKLLPRLKDTLGSEITARRPLAPAPPQLPPFFIPGVTTLYFEDLPIRLYRICGVHYNMQQPPHETRSERARATIDGRRVTYHLEVVQQPEKARACGSGNKSSNDRRPVDPPPVVELKVFVNGVDVTMSYDATFLLYASLEIARPMANGKIHTPQTVPVLAGVTVASAAYLEKPKRAAYFIFPDLSVRHEGWYRLRFSLFEGIKHPNDADPDKPFDLAPSMPKADDEKPRPPVRQEGVLNRMDVLSTPFQVFSAKKFPGLDQSTELSVLVADQGCRVRIRRDVRQRKRHQKPGPDTVDAHSSYQGTPRAPYAPIDHSRSDSRNSLGSHHERISQRRESVESQYGRPILASRQMSTSSMSMTSPLPSTPTSAMPPPPPYSQYPMRRPSLDNLPKASLALAPTPASHYPPVSSRPALPNAMNHEPNLSPRENTLPPLRSNLGYEPRQLPKYHVPAPSATKRSLSPNEYGDHTALKSGARPDAISQYFRSLPLGENDIIEPDVVTTADSSVRSDPTQPLYYVKADGTTSHKYFQGGSYFQLGL